MSELNTLLNELALKHFYGSLEVKFENGRVVLLRRIENIKLTDSYRTTGGDRERY